MEVHCEAYVNSFLFFSTRLRIHCSCFVYVWLGRHLSIATLRPERRIALMAEDHSRLGSVDPPGQPMGLNGLSNRSPF